MKIIPVIHYLTHDQVERNLDIVQEVGLSEVALIDMSHNTPVAPHGEFKNAAQAYLLHKREGLHVIVNDLTKSAADSAMINAGLGFEGTWSDHQLTHTIEGQGTRRKEYEQELTSIEEVLSNYPAHEVYSGVAFKYLAYEPDPGLAALELIKRGLIPTTSGPATGQEIDISKIKTIRSAIGPYAKLAVASGVTAHNARWIKGWVTHAFVASSILDPGHDEIISAVKLKALIAAAQ